MAKTAKKEDFLLSSLSAEDQAAIIKEFGDDILKNTKPLSDIMNETINQRGNERLKAWFDSSKNTKQRERLLEHYAKNGKQRVDIAVPSTDNGRTAVSFAEITADEVYISRKIQRDINFEDIIKRDADFEINATRNVTVVVNNSIAEFVGKFISVDGMHTCALCYSRGEAIVAQVITINEPDVKKFAMKLGNLFSKLNSRKPVSGWDLGRAKAANGNAMWKSIIYYVEKFNINPVNHSNPTGEGDLSRITTVAKCVKTFGMDNVVDVMSFSKNSLNNAGMSGFVFATLATLFYEAERNKIKINRKKLADLFYHTDGNDTYVISSQKMDKVLQYFGFALIGATAPNSIVSKIEKKDEFGNVVCYADNLKVSDSDIKLYKEFYTRFSPHTDNFVVGRVYALIYLYNMSVSESEKIAPFKLERETYSL